MGRKFGQAAMDARLLVVRGSHAWQKVWGLAGALAVFLVVASQAAAGPIFSQVNLVSDIPGLAAATDANLVNPWGISFGPNTPFWVSDNGMGVATLYRGNGNQVPLIVTIPPPGGSPPGTAATPTGQVFNNTGDPTAFVVSAGGTSASSRFIFATEDGTIAGWNPGVPPPPTSTQAHFGVDNSASGAVYKGLALANNGSGNFLYATNFRAGTIDVFDKNFAPAGAPGSFTDPNAPAGFAPFNIANIGGLLYVTFAMQDGSKHDDVPGPGNGFIDIFNANGLLVRRFATGTGAGGTLTELNSPWGLTVAPAGFGSFSHDLLVGNFGDGRVNVFDPNTGNFLGQLDGPNGNPITIDGLWALVDGTGASLAVPGNVYFTAGLNGEQDGLFGRLHVPEPSSLLLLASGIAGLVGSARARRRQP